VSKLLAIYLNDHLTGATIGLELVRRSAGSNRGSLFEPELRELGGEFAEDRRTLAELMGRLQVGTDRMKVALGWCAEKLGRVKPNGRLLSYSPLSRLEELEALSLGVTGKLLLWRALEQALGADPRLAGIDLGVMQGRARGQLERIERLRQMAARQALAT
jgi:hypothetical protein